MHRGRSWEVRLQVLNPLNDFTRCVIALRFQLKDALLRNFKLRRSIHCTFKPQRIGECFTLKLLNDALVYAARSFVAGYCTNRCCAFQVIR